MVSCLLFDLHTQIAVFCVRRSMELLWQYKPRCWPKYCFCQTGLTTRQEEIDLGGGSWTCTGIVLVWGLINPPIHNIHNSHAFSHVTFRDYPNCYHHPLRPGSLNPCLSPLGYLRKMQPVVCKECNFNIHITLQILIGSAIANKTTDNTSISALGKDNPNRAVHLIPNLRDLGTTGGIKRPTFFRTNWSVDGGYRN